MISTLPDYKYKDELIKSIIKLQKTAADTTKKYEKTNEDKLAVTHLLSKVNQELEQSLSNEKRFIASVSHELRTPLTAILGYSELFEDTALNNKQKRYLDSIIQSSHHLLSLISDLLDVAKLEDNRVELSPREFDLDDVINECVSLTQSRMEKGVELITDIPLLDYSIIGDDKRMKQIFLNLLSNAAKFTKKGTIKFYIDKIEDLGNNKIRIVANVDDTGDGIPDEVKSTLFDPFQSTDKTQGTGLGLFISQRLADLMDGEIVVHSEAGVGSHFSVNLEVEKSTNKEIGKELENANVVMFGSRDDFSQKLFKDLNGLHVNFQQYDVRDNDFTTPLAQMVIGGKFYDIGILDQDLFKSHTNSIGGTFKAVNPNIKLVALVSEDSDADLSEFDIVIAKPISHQKLVKRLEDIYAKEFFYVDEEVNYSNLNVLIVEDVELNREYEKEMLDNFFSISSDVAENGKIAVEKVKNNNYDIILMDMRMPVMDGLEATRKIREFNKDIPIICMSANVYKEDKIAAEESGMNNFIEKPLDKSDIAEKLAIYTGAEYKAQKAQEKIAESSEDKSKYNYSKIALMHLQSNFDDSIAKRLHMKAMENIKAYMKRINTSFGNKDTKALLEDFHALKGVLSNIGLGSLKDMAGDLQTLSAEGDLMKISEPKDKLLAEIKLLLQQVDRAS